MNIQKMFYAYHGCHGSIFPPPKFMWKMEIFQIKPICLLLLLKQELQKKYQECSKKYFTHINMVAMATYSPPSQFFVKNKKKNQIKPIFKKIKN